jgi:hypothetical protein
MALAKRPHVVVATPGRLVDHLENTKAGDFRGKPWDFLGIYRETSMGFLMIFDVLNKNAANYAQNHDFFGFPMGFPHETMGF